MVHDLSLIHIFQLLETFLVIAIAIGVTETSLSESPDIVFYLRGEQLVFH